MMAGFEHALFLVLLLGFLLRELKNRHPINFLLIIIGMVLIQVPPHIGINIPWELFLAAALPWILWQYARNWLQVMWRIPWKETFVWTVSTISLALIFTLVGILSWPQAIFLGMVATSMFWKVSGGEQKFSPLEIVGPLTLVLLLAETSLQLDDPIQYLGGLFSGAGVGIVVAILSILMSRKLPRRDNLILLGLVYLAYWIALALNSSPIAASLIGIAVFYEFHYLRLEEDEKSRDKPASRFGSIPFITILVLFVFLSWQAHQPMALTQWYEVILGMITGILVAVFGQRIGLARFKRWGLNARNALILGLFLFGILTLWPRGTDLEQVITWVAIGLSFVLLILSKVLLSALHNMDEQREITRDEKYPHF